MDQEYKYRFHKYMTQEMLDNLIDPHYLERELELCKHMLWEARQASLCDLPATAASGEKVLHGARNQMDTICAYWTARGYAADELLEQIRVRK